MRWSKLAKAVSLSLALAAAAVVMQPLATPAHAGAVVTQFVNGDIVKLKTTWGGGWVLNFGETAGSTIEGRQALVHWNVAWDNQNRFLVTGPPVALNGHVWAMLKNRWSGLCLSAQPLADHTIVTQEFCSNFDAGQKWAGVWPPGSGTLTLINFAHFNAGLNTVLSQKLFEVVGSPIWMETNFNNQTRQKWQLQSCIWSGVEQRDC